ncbi:hypothetical protein DL768_010942 [Monosporascus sp. mg162]|nr:hypothetical protein DL768_010942 [Monosporascus sp. mg162]
MVTEMRGEDLTEKKNWAKVMNYRAHGLEVTHAAFFANDPGYVDGLEGAPYPVYDGRLINPRPRRYMKRCFFSSTGGSGRFDQALCTYVFTFTRSIEMESAFLFPHRGVPYVDADKELDDAFQLLNNLREPPLCDELALYSFVSDGAIDDAILYAIEQSWHMPPMFMHLSMLTYHL